jgi:hypothetical protein
MADLRNKKRFLSVLSGFPWPPRNLSNWIRVTLAWLGVSEVRGRDSFVVRLMTGARSIWTSVPEADWIGYTIPITWKGDYLLNGMSATRTTVFRLDGANEFDVVAESRDFVTVGIRRSVLSRMISGLIGRDFAILLLTRTDNCTFRRPTGSGCWGSSGSRLLGPRRTDRKPPLAGCLVPLKLR